MKNFLKPIMVVLPVVIVAVGLYAFSMLPKSDTVSIEGSVEIPTNSYFSKVNGTVTDVLVEMGQEVKSGDTLAIIDSSEHENEIEQLKATLVMKNAKLNELNKSPKADAVIAARKAAQDNVIIYQEKLSMKEKALKDAEEDLQKQITLFEAGAVAEKDVEEYKKDVEEKKSEVSIAKSELSAAKNSVNIHEYPEKSLDEIDGAIADIKLTELQIEKLENSRDDYIIKAINNGIVINRNVSYGSSVISGQSLFEISEENNRYFVFYLAEEHLGKIEYGDILEIYRINETEPIGTAEVTYMDLKAVYTPKDYENTSNKNKKSVKIKGLINSENNVGVGETLVVQFQNDDK